jgi:hypothetical protein
MIVSSFAYLSLVLAAATMGSTTTAEAEVAARPPAPSQPVTTSAEAEEARRLAEWKAKYVRPCVKSGNRLTC